MKLSIEVLATAAVLAVVGAAAQGLPRTERSACCALEISAPPDPVKAGSPLIINTTVTNSSDHEVLVGIDKRGQEYTIDAHDVSAGTGANAPLAPDTRLGRFWNGHADLGHLTQEEERDHMRSLTGDVAYAHVKAHDELSYPLNVSNVYDLSKPGKYSIQCERLDPERKSMLVSNVIVVTVVPSNSGEK